MKKAFSLLLISAMVLSATSCGGQGAGSSGSGSTPASNATGTSNSAATDVVTAEGEFPITKETTTLKVMVPSATSITDITTNEFTKWYEEKTNIKVNWEVIPQDNVSETVNISLSSGDMPDMYMSCGVSQTQQAVYGGQKAFLPLNDYISKYSKLMQEIMTKIPNLESVMTMGDGNIYALPSIEKCPHCEVSYKMWMNTKWLSNLGLEKPTTIEEFETVLRAFKENDANGNGDPNDEIPLLAFEKGWHSSLTSGYLTTPFVYSPADSNYVYLEDGKVQLSYMQEGWKDAMIWLNKLYKEGLIYDQSLTLTNEQANQVAQSGKDGVSVVGAYPNGVPTGVPGDPPEFWTDYQCLTPLEGPAGRNAVWNAYGQITPTAFVITSNCKTPEAAFRWAAEMYDRDICFRKTFGVEGTGWKKVTPGQDGVAADAVDTRSGKPSQVNIYADGVLWGDEQNYAWRHFGARCDTMDFPELRYDQLQPGSYENDLEYRLAYDTKDFLEPYRPDIEMVLPPMVYTEAQATTLANSEAVVLSYVQEMAARFITGDANIDSEWAAYLSELDVKGATVLKGIYQDAYTAKYK